MRQAGGRALVEPEERAPNADKGRLDGETDGQLDAIDERGDAGDNRGGRRVGEGRVAERARDQPLPSVVQPVQLSEVLVHTRATKAGRGARRSPASRAPYIHTWAKKQNSTDYVVCRERRLDLA